MLFAFAGVVLVLTIYAIWQGLDIRLALLCAAFAIATVAGDPTAIVRTFLATFSNEKFFLPIGTAMGFAYVLKHTECDRHLVRLLMRPVSMVPFLMVPGVVVVGFLVNIPVISQTSTAVCLGAVVVPLMQAAGLSPTTIGATLLLGSSIGGELLNPGAPELNTVGERLGCSSASVIQNVTPFLFPHLLFAMFFFVYLTRRAEHRASVSAPASAEGKGPTTEPVAESVSLRRAVVPIVPLIFLFLTNEPFQVVEVPKSWVVEPTAEKSYPTRLIGFAMLIGTACAAAAAPKKSSGVPKAFFEGGGYAFTHILSLIVTANCFGTAIEMIGLASLLLRLVESAPELLLPLAAVLPLLFGLISGSGMASTQSLYGSFVDPSLQVGLDPKEVGAVVSIGAAAGRTMSPVAAVTLMCADLTRTNPFVLAQRLAGPLLLSMCLVIFGRQLAIW